jgi:hypothetical protein
MMRVINWVVLSIMLVLASCTGSGGREVGAGSSDKADEDGVDPTGCVDEAQGDRWDAKLAEYVLDRLDGRVENGSPAASLQELVDVAANMPMQLDTNSLRCLGYEAPDSTGKAVGVCLIDARDKDGDPEEPTLEARFSVSITADIEHGDTSRGWEVGVQQYLYF